VTTNGLAASTIFTIASLKSFKLTTGVSAAGMGFFLVGLLSSDSALEVELFVSTSVAASFPICKLVKLSSAMGINREMITVMVLVILFIVERFYRFTSSVSN
jgi:hypothetical protein